VTLAEHTQPFLMQSRTCGRRTWVENWGLVRALWHTGKFKAPKFLPAGEGRGLRPWVRMQ
jgi:hypothetical protein